MKKTKKFIVFFIALYFSTHYFWLIIWKENETMLLVGDDLFSIIASLIATLALLQTYKRNPPLGKPFWLLLALGCFSFFIAEIIWAYYDCILHTEVPYPGIADIFYMLQIGFFLTSFFYLFLKLKGTYSFVRFLFDMALLITVAATLSWIYVLKPTLAIPDFSHVFLVFTLGYPLADLVLLVVIVSIYIGFETPLIKREILLFFGLIVQLFADSSYAFLNIKDHYFSGNQIDALYSLGLLLIGFSGFYYEQSENQNPILVRGNSRNEQLNFFRISIPYLGIIVLFIVTLIQTKEMNGLHIGSIIALLLIIFRQFIAFSENKINEAKIHFMGQHDLLTNVPNRALFMDIFQRVLAESKNNHTLLALMYIDLDRFKTINDSISHEVGDLLLIQVSERLKGLIRKSDTVARFGGDEFTVLLKGFNKVEDVSAIANKILRSLNQPYFVQGHIIISTPSIGIAVSSIDGMKPETLMQRANFALCQVKETGRNQFRLYSQDKNDDRSQKYTLEQDLHHALSRNELSVCYQPQIDINNGKIIGVEALLRWTHPVYGPVSPMEFIPIAEDTGLIFPIGEWVLRTSCLQAVKWHNAGHPIKMAVNLSPRQFRKKNMVELVKEVLDSTGLRPEYLDLEITEGIAMNEVNLAIQRLQALKQLGVKISIDDFGTGFSSLSYLPNFPIDTLKIAREFIRKIGENQANDAIIASIISLGHNLEMLVLAEGVEDKEQLEYLESLNCNQVQGFLFAKAITAEEVEEYFFEVTDPVCNT